MGQNEWQRAEGFWSRGGAAAVWWKAVWHLGGVRLLGLSSAVGLSMGVGLGVDGVSVGEGRSGGRRSVRGRGWVGG